MVGDKPYWSICRRRQKEQRRKKWERIRPTVESKVSELAGPLEVEHISQYQIRFEKTLDLFPKDKRYHVIRGSRQGERGSYDDLVSFVQSFFNRKYGV